MDDQILNDKIRHSQLAFTAFVQHDNSQFFQTDWPARNLNSNVVMQDMKEIIMEKIIHNKAADITLAAFDIDTALGLAFNLQIVLGQILPNLLEIRR